MARNAAATVFVGNLDSRVNERILFNLMQQAGPVVDLYMPRQQDQSKQDSSKQNQDQLPHRGFGFAEYEDERSAEYAVKLFSGLVRLFGRHVRFQISTGGRAATPAGAASASKGPEEADPKTEPAVPQAPQSSERLAKASSKTLQQSPSKHHAGLDTNQAAAKSPSSDVKDEPKEDNEGVPSGSRKGRDGASVMGLKPRRVKARLSVEDTQRSMKGRSSEQDTKRSREPPELTAGFVNPKEVKAFAHSEDAAASKSISAAPNSSILVAADSKISAAPDSFISAVPDRNSPAAQDSSISAAPDKKRKFSDPQEEAPPKYTASKKAAPNHAETTKADLSSGAPPGAAVDRAVSRRNRAASDGSAQPADSRPADWRPADSRCTDSRAADSRPANSRLADSRAADLRAADSRADDSRAADSGPADLRPADSKAAGLRSASIPWQPPDAPLLVVHAPPAQHSSGDAPRLLVHASLEQESTAAPNTTSREGVRPWLHGSQRNSPLAPDGGGLLTVPPGPAPHAPPLPVPALGGAPQLPAAPAAASSALHGLGVSASQWYAPGQVQHHLGRGQQHSPGHQQYLVQQQLQGQQQQQHLVQQQQQQQLHAQQQYLGQQQYIVQQEQQGLQQGTLPQLQLQPQQHSAAGVGQTVHQSSLGAGYVSLVSLLGRYHNQHNAQQRQPVQQLYLQPQPQIPQSQSLPVLGTSAHYVAATPAGHPIAYGSAPPQMQMRRTASGAVYYTAI